MSIWYAVSISIFCVIAGEAMMSGHVPRVEETGKWLWSAVMTRVLFCMIEAVSAQERKRPSCRSK